MAGTFADGEAAIANVGQCDVEVFETPRACQWALTHARKSLQWAVVRGWTSAVLEASCGSIAAGGQCFCCLALVFAKCNGELGGCRVGLLY
jgi:hypothetical protein